LRADDFRACVTSQAQDAQIAYEMSFAIDYSFDKSSIKTGCYAPQGYLTIDLENSETRRLWLEILRGNRGLPMAPFRHPPAQPTPPQNPPPSS
jgi:hypothetical protein